MNSSLLKYITVLVSILSSSVSGAEWCSDFTNPRGQSAPIIVDGSDVEEDFRQNKDITLYCCFESQPTANVTWFKNDQPIVAGKRHQFSENNQVLTIFNSTSSDAGNYRCQGSNKHGHQFHKMIVHVHPPRCQNTPDIRHKQASVRANVGGMAKLSCIVMLNKSCDSLLPVFLWSDPKGKVELIRNKSKVQKINGKNEVKMVLKLKSVQRNQAGSHSCIVRDINGQKSSKVSLIVY